jgi:D-alanyl-D-alanine carboxypeptidase
MDILNVANWSKERIQNYEKAVKSAAEVGMSLIPYKELRFKVGSVEFASDRLKAMVPDSTNKKIFVSKGAPIKDYMKQINKFSMNYPADVMFLALGGAGEFKKFMAEKYKADMHDVNIAVGSGLYTEDKNGRFDGTATCALMVEVIASMNEKLKTENYDLKDVMMVGGIDQGTTFGLYSGSNKAGAVITKTGTLRNAITYAGELKTKDGDIYFGAFFQSAAMASARAARNKVVAELFSDNGGPKAIKYKSPVFRPFDAGSKMYEVMPRNSKSQIKLSSNP